MITVSRGEGDQTVYYLVPASPHYQATQFMMFCILNGWPLYNEQVKCPIIVLVTIFFTGFIIVY
jgi:hypothetical protein